MTTPREMLKTVFTKLLQEEKYSSQIEIAVALKERGIGNFSQSTISKMLINVGAIRLRNSLGEKVYCIPAGLSASLSTNSLKCLIISVEHNKHMVVLHTTAGAAQFVARVLDSHGKKAGILGTITDDDTVFITPIPEQSTLELLKQLAELIM